MNTSNRLTIADVRAAYISGKITPKRLIEQIISRSKEHSDYNIWITPPELEKIKPYIDALEYKNIVDYPLWGIPFAIKDNIDLEAVPTTAGCPEYAYTPDKSAFVVERLIDAGAIPIGKTNLDQFATGLVGTRSPYGEVKNSLNPELISGGSSSGSAVSVALGEAVFALGTDTAGSGRVPAALNCLVGYKPACGAWSTSGLVPACESLDCITVFANSIDDAEAVNDIVRGYDKNCIWSKQFAKLREKRPSKIYLPVSELDFYGPYAQTYMEKWDRELVKIQSIGIPVEFIDTTMFKKAAAILYEGPWVAERWEALGEFVENNENAIFPVTREILKGGSKPENTASYLFNAWHELEGYKHVVRELLDDAVLIMPTAGGTYTRDEVREDPIGKNSDMGKYTNHCNLLDLCAIAIPENKDDKDIPFGVTIFSLAKNEGTILGVARALE